MQQTTQTNQLTALQKAIIRVLPQASLAIATDSTDQPNVRAHPAQEQFLRLMQRWLRKNIKYVMYYFSRSSDGQGKRAGYW